MISTPHRLARVTALCLLLASAAHAASWSLDEYPVKLIQQDWGTARSGRCFDGTPLRLGGKTYEHGIGTLAKSEIGVKLDGKAQEFTALVGISERQKSSERVVEFIVEGDGKLLWKSGPLRADADPVPVAVKLDGVKVLTLRVGPEKKNNSDTHANWADATISYAGAEPAPNFNIVGLATRQHRLDYVVRKDGTLELLKFGSRDGKWSTPLVGSLFPGVPVRTGNGPRYIGPLALTQTNGDTALEPIYESHEIVKPAPGIEHLIVRLRDRIYPIRIELHLESYAAQDVYRQWLVLKNDTDKPLKVSRLDSLYLPGLNAKGLFLEWYESKEGAEAGTPYREKLAQGTRLLESRDGNRHKSGPIPAFVLGFGQQPAENSAPCLIAALEWSANSRFSFDINNQDFLELSAGVNQPGQVTVDAGQSLASPAAVLALSGAGKGPASRNLHRWQRQHCLRDGNRVRPIDNNSWEGCYMDVSEAAILQMMKDSAGLGIELYVLDDGWFGDRRNLGDWWVNPKLFPKGLGYLVDEGKKMGMDFGIWFEPEMINEGSKLSALHPEWIMRAPAGRENARQRNQVALDVANPAVQEFMFKSVDDILKAAPGIRYVKWDCNSNINNPFSPSLPADRQGDMLNRYMEGFYRTMDKLVNAYPAVDFQACAAGGGRADLGALRYAHTYWPSDQTNPNYRLGAQWNFSTFFAPMAVTCHVTHNGGNMFKPKYRFDISMVGQLGMEVDTRKSDAEYLAGAKVGIAAFKTIRDIVQLGDQYRHGHPFDSSTPSLNYVSVDQNRAVVFAYQTADMKQPTPVVSPVAGLDPAKSYQVAEINLPEGDAQPRLAPGTPAIQTGDAWMKSGLPLVFTRKFDSAAVTLEVAP